ncbi:MAG: hypothetical protein EAX91_16670 [Candidatus Lokiarchaeota archaeon]|nr:hypothetical protein [Candidatus Lokiarchaeota archaeon]
MKQKSLYLVIIVFALLCIELVQNVFGDGIVLKPPKNPFITIPLIIGLFFIGVRVESAHFNTKFFNKYNYTYVSKSRFKVFLRINLVTFPLAQIFTYFIYVFFIQFFWLSVFLIEVEVIIIETFLLRIELRRLVGTEIPTKSILIKTTYANMASFLIGLLAYVITIAIYTPFLGI